MSKTELAPVPKRRSYPKALKSRIVDECRLPGISIAGVALSHGVNANLVHRWIRQAKQAGRYDAGVHASRIASRARSRSSHRDPLVTRPRASNGAMARE